MLMCMRLLLVVLAATLSGCDGPCEDLAAHARDCRFAAGPYTAPEDSMCHAAQDALGAEGLDGLQGCVTASCDADIGACVQTYASGDPCEQLIVWAAACALEPPGATNGCASLRESFSGPAFARWTACVTAGACPGRDD